MCIHEVVRNNIKINVNVALSLLLDQCLCLPRHSPNELDKVLICHCSVNSFFLWPQMAKRINK